VGVLLFRSKSHEGLFDIVAAFCLLISAAWHPCTGLTSKPVSILGS
jgi:hypothetical protein